MKHLLALLLIPYFVVGNPFFHSHDEGVHADEHQGRTHIHIGESSNSGHLHSSEHSHEQSDGDHHHPHRSSCVSTSGKSLQPAQLAPEQHDADALYVQDTDLAVPPSPMGVSKAELNCIDHLVELSPTKISTGPCINGFAKIFPDCPIFLLHAALRL